MPLNFKDKRLCGVCCFFTVRGFVSSATGCLRGNQGGLFDTFNPLYDGENIFCHAVHDEIAGISTIFVKSPSKDYRGRKGSIGCAVSIKQSEFRVSEISDIVDDLIVGKGRLQSILTDFNFDSKKNNIEKIVFDVFGEAVGLLDEKNPSIRYVGNFQSKASNISFNIGNTSDEEISDIIALTFSDRILSNSDFVFSDLGKDGLEKFSSTPLLNAKWNNILKEERFRNYAIGIEKPPIQQQELQRKSEKRYTEESDFDKSYSYTDLIDIENRFKNDLRNLSNKFDLEILKLKNKNPIVSQRRNHDDLNHEQYVKDDRSMSDFDDLKPASRFNFLHFIESYWLFLSVGIAALAMILAAFFLFRESTNNRQYITGNSAIQNSRQLDFRECRDFKPSHSWDRNSMRALLDRVYLDEQDFLGCLLYFQDRVLREKDNCSPGLKLIDSFTVELWVDLGSGRIDLDRALDQYDFWFKKTEAEC